MEPRDAVFRGVFQSEKRYEGRAWGEIVVLRVTLDLPKLEDTNGNTQHEPRHRVIGSVPPHRG